MCVGAAVTVAVGSVILLLFFINVCVGVAVGVGGVQQRRPGDSLQLEQASKLVDQYLLELTNGITHLAQQLPNAHSLAEVCV